MWAGATTKIPPSNLFFTAAGLRTALATVPSRRQRTRHPGPPLPGQNLPAQHTPAQRPGRPTMPLISSGRLWHMDLGRYFIGHLLAPALRHITNKW